MNDQPKALPELSIEQAQQILDEDILTGIGAHGEPLKSPVFFVVSGQPGAGKSTTIRQITNRFSGQPTQVIIPDDLLSYVPGYNDALLANHDKSIPKFEVPDDVEAALELWQRKLVRRALARRANIILESCYAPQIYRGLTNTARQKGYTLEINIIATDRRTSLASIHDRFQKALEKRSIANTTLPDKDTHDYYYAQLPRIAFEVENHNLFDRLAIVRRGEGAIYQNELVKQASGEFDWKDKPKAMQSLLLARNRPLNEKQMQWLNATWDKIANNENLKAHYYARGEYVAIYRDEMKGFTKSEGSRFDLFTVKKEDQKAAGLDYHTFLAEDLQMTLDNKSDAKDFIGADFEDRFDRAIRGFNGRVIKTIRRTVSASNALIKGEADISEPQNLAGKRKREGKVNAGERAALSPDEEACERPFKRARTPGGNASSNDAATEDVQAENTREAATVQDAARRLLMLRQRPMAGR